MRNPADRTGDAGAAPSASSTNLKRRRFLFALGASGAAGAAAAASPAVTIATADTHPEPDTTSGYRETEHVRNYYDSTRI